MDKQQMPGNPVPQLRDLAAGDTVSIIGRGGSVVRVLQGRTWITQEGDARDYVVPAGTRFCAARNGHIVVSAVADDTRIAIYHVDPVPGADWAHNRIRLDPDFAIRTRRAAHRAQALYIAGLFCRLWHRILQVWSRRRSALPTLPVRRSHC